METSPFGKKNKTKNKKKKKKKNKKKKKKKKKRHLTLTKTPPYARLFLYSDFFVNLQTVAFPLGPMGKTITSIIVQIFKNYFFQDFSYTTSYRDGSII